MDQHVASRNSVIQFAHQSSDFLSTMVGKVDLAKRALITLIKALALAYGITANVMRESPDPAVVSAYRRLSLKVHPDRGGS